MKYQYTITLQPSLHSKRNAQDEKRIKYTGKKGWKNLQLKNLSPNKIGKTT